MHRVRIGNQPEAGNNFRGSTIPENKGIIVLISRVHQVPPGGGWTSLNMGYPSGRHSIKQTNK